LMNTIRPELQRARLAVEILREQARSAPYVGTTDNWHTTARNGLGWATRAASALRGVAVQSGPVQPMESDLVQLGTDLQAQSDVYAKALEAGDYGQIESLASLLGPTSDKLLEISAELDSLAVAYNVVGD
jgi:hypothetical protein